MNERPKVGVGVIVIKNGKVLMQKRKGAHGEGTWSFPGGHLEFGESIEQCAKREVMEEFGIKIKNVKSGPFTNDVFDSENKHYITIFALAEIESGEPKIMESDKTKELGFFAWENMPKPLFRPIINLINQNFNPLNLV